MLRNSILYHRFWYVKKRNSKRAKLLMRLAAIIIILSVSISYANGKILPYLFQISQIKAEGMINDAVSKTVEDIFSEGLEYGDIVNIEQDRNGSITSIATDMVKLNKLSAEISRGIHEKLIQLQKDKIPIPMGTLLGATVLAATGPNIYVDVQPYEIAQVDFKSEFTNEGINQTRHRLYLEVRTKVELSVPLLYKESEVVSSIPVVEAVIMGKVKQIPTLHFAASSSTALLS
jgi:sporulation protein YunB